VEGGAPGLKRPVIGENRRVPPVEVLVSLVHPDGTAAVYSTDDEPRLTADLASDGALVLDRYRPGSLPLSEDRSLEGGLAPEGALAAELVTPTGERLQAPVANGAWVAVVERERSLFWNRSPVRFVDASGNTVRRPLPEDCRRKPVEDAEEPCPACGRRSWEEVRPDALGPWDRETDPFVSCSACGHEELMARSLHGELPEDPDPPEVIAASRLEMERRHKQDRHRFLEQVDFPIYAAARWPRRFTGGVREGDAPLSASVEHGARGDEAGPAFSIETEREDPDWREFRSEVAWARQTLEFAVSADETEWPRRSDAGTAIWRASRQREHARTALTASREVLEFEIDDTPRRFACLSTGERWVAVGRAGDLRLTITARGVDPSQLRLERVSDPLSLLGDASA
jgi:hypothetical protein